MKSKIHNHIIFALLFLLGSNVLQAQDLLDQLYFEQDKQTQLTEATFKMLRIGLGHSTETRKKGVLELSSYTRYWNIPEIEGQVVEPNNFASDRSK